MTELEVLNQMLGTLGEAPLQDADDEHPLLPAAKRRLRQTSQTELARGWWFNREVVTLNPEPDLEIVKVPNDALSIDPVDTNSTIVQRGFRLYDTALTTYNIGVAVKVQLIRDLPFDSVPYNMQNLIAAASTKLFNLDYDGDSTKLKQAEQAEKMARIELGREEIRNADVNLFRRGSTAQTLNRICGTSGRLRTA